MQKKKPDRLCNRKSNYLTNHTYYRHTILQQWGAMLSRVLRAWLLRVSMPLANPRTHLASHALLHSGLRRLLKASCISLFHFLFPVVII